jgi:hypothetical protein
VRASPSPSAGPPPRAFRTPTFPAFPLPSVFAPHPSTRACESRRVWGFETLPPCPRAARSPLWEGPRGVGGAPGGEGRAPLIAATWSLRDPADPFLPFFTPVEPMHQIVSSRGGGRREGAEEGRRRRKRERTPGNLRGQTWLFIPPTPPSNSKKLFNGANIYCSFRPAQLIAHNPTYGQAVLETRGDPTVPLSSPEITSGLKFGALPRYLLNRF